MAVVREWKETIHEQVYALESSDEKTPIWKVFPRAVSVMLLAYGEDALCKRMYAEEDALLSEYVESGQPVPDRVVVLLKEMIGRYVDALDEIADRRLEMSNGLVIVTTRGCFSRLPDPDEEFRFRLKSELFKLFLQYGLSGDISMSDAELITLFLQRVEERKMLWTKRKGHLSEAEAAEMRVPPFSEASLPEFAFLYGNHHKISIDQP